MIFPSFLTVKLHSKFYTEDAEDYLNRWAFSRQQNELSQPSFPLENSLPTNVKTSKTEYRRKNSDAVEKTKSGIHEIKVQEQVSLISCGFLDIYIILRNHVP